MRVEKIINNILREELADQLRNEVKPDVRRVATIIRIILPLNQVINKKQLPKNGLEIGTGRGQLIFPLARLFPEFRWYGIEHPNHYNLKNNIKYPIDIKLHDITKGNLPFNNNHFSIITFSEVLEHLPIESIPNILKELHRILSPGGYLIATSPNLVSFPNRIAILLGNSIFHSPVDKNGVLGHIRMYTANEFISFCKPIGLSPRKIKYINLLKYMKENKPIKDMIYKMCRINDLMCLMTKRFGDTWCVVLTKERQG